MTIKEYLAERHPKVAAVLVTVTEVCTDAHPPKSTSWTYSGSAAVDREVLGRLYHDSTTLKTAHFDLLTPIRNTLIRKLTNHNGKLSPYYCDDGKVVTRQYDCEITLHQATPDKLTRE